MKTKNKWFTLAELIIVIVILAILWTIWFMSYSSYVVTARDSQRKSDISIINKEIKKISLNWFNLITLVNTWIINNTWSWEFYIGGKNLSLNSNYKAWSINFDYLVNISNKLLDPKTKNEYVLWVYNNNYEVTSSLEETKTTYIVSSYKKRTSSWTLISLTWTIDTSNNSITLLNKENSIKYQIWDYIWTWTTNYKEIIDIVWEKIYLNNVSWLNIIDKIRLFKDDTWIIWNSKIWVWTWTNCNDLTNLKQNICPLKEDIPNLLPYQF
jgi:Tfp pilus assembly major pilin PilA